MLDPVVVSIVTIAKCAGKLPLAFPSLLHHLNKIPSPVVGKTGQQADIVFPVLQHLVGQPVPVIKETVKHIALRGPDADTVTVTVLIIGIGGFGPYLLFPRNTAVQQLPLSHQPAGSVVGIVYPFSPRAAFCRFPFLCLFSGLDSLLLP